MNYHSVTNLKIKNLFKNSFERIKTELWDKTGKKNPFVFVGTTQIILLFRKISDNVIWLRNGCTKFGSFSYFSWTCKTPWMKF